MSFLKGSLLLNLLCYTVLVTSYSHILSRGTAWVQIQVAEKMLAMSSRYATRLFSRVFVVLLKKITYI